MNKFEDESADKTKDIMFAKALIAVFCSLSVNVNAGKTLVGTPNLWERECNFGIGSLSNTNTQFKRSRVLLP